VNSVAVTGLGVESCVGSDIDTFWEAVSNGRSGIKPLTGIDAPDFPVAVAGRVEALSHDMEPTEARRASRFQRLLFSAVSQAVADRGGELDGARTALVVGTAAGGIPFLCEGVEESIDKLAARGPAVLERLFLLKAMPNMAAGLVANHFGITGPSLTISTSCAASADAAILAHQLVASGVVDVAIAAGTEAWVNHWVLAGFVKLSAISLRPAEEAAIACRPFDAARDGMVPAEGAAALVLERAEIARAAGRRVRAEVLGGASTSDASHPVQPRPDGVPAAAAITRALDAAGLAPSDVDYVNAHGTSTRLNDVAETRALRVALGPHAERTAISSTKSMIGHALGAAAALELVATVLALEHQFVPPTINLDNPDPECDLDYTAHKGHSAAIDVAVKCSFGFAGQNAALVLRAPQE
jgi:3-oxoacyl-[acyl-carrier-protein] synthase II